MSWEQPVYSFNHGQPPTPTQTPTSATFDEKEFSTPKAESSFYDPRVTWDTADPNATSPNLLKTPKPYTLTPTLHHSIIVSSERGPILGQDLEAGVASHASQTSSTSIKPLPTADPKYLLSSSSNLRSAKKDYSTSIEALTPPVGGLDLDVGSSMQSASSMQTPPPTSSSTSRRKGKKAQAAKEMAQSDTEGRRISMPLFPATTSLDMSAIPAEASPQQFSALQFSPDVFEFPMSGPSTVPAYTQNKLFWEPKHDEGMDVDFSGSFPDLFGTPHQPTLDPFVSAHHQASSTQTTTSSSFLDFHESSAKTSTLTVVSSGLEKDSFVSTAGTVRNNNPSRKSVASGVDPSLLFSSPGRAAEPLQVSMTSTVVLDDEALQPYAYQMQEAKREKAYGGIEKPKKRRKPDSDSPAVKAALETLRGNDDEDPRVRCSMVDTVVLRTNKHAKQSSRASLSDARRIFSSHGRSSSTKRSQSKSTRTIRRTPQRRTSLALTIDSTGRARTEKCTIVDGSRTVIGDDVMGARHQSDSSDSETSSDDLHDAMVMSQAPSFNFPTDYPQTTKGRRAAHNSVSHSSKSSYTSIHTSTSFAEDWQEKAHHRFNSTQPSIGSIQRGSQSVLPGVPMSSESSQSSSRSYIGDSLSDADTIMESDEDDDGSAQHELRKVLKNREVTRHPQAAKPKRYLHSPLAGQSSSRHARVNTGSSHKAAPNSLNGISPSTMSDPGLPLPDSASRNLANGTVRCVCHMTNNTGLMIACDSCKNSLHIRCVTSDPQRLPQVYLCVFCTGQTPNVRGGRVRDSSRVGYAAPGSPLAQKSSRFR